MANSLLRLGDKSTVVIIGGGPSGASRAIKLKELTGQQGIHPRIVVYEGKLFEQKNQHNQCLGVLSPPLNKIMEDDLGIPFPWPIIQKKIDGYFIHTEKNVLRLAGEHEPSYACRRIEFDSYLDRKAKEAGVEVITARVIDLDFFSDGVMAYSETNNIKADIIVGAFGLDDGTAMIFERRTPYRQPKFLSSVVTKIHPGDEAISGFKSYIHAFLPSSLLQVESGAITPKGNHLSLNIAGKNVDAVTMDRFLNLPVVRAVLPAAPKNTLPPLPYFKGKFPTGPAKAPIGKKVCYGYGEGAEEVERMDYLQFIARVTSHLSDKGQVTIRYFGLYANAHRGKVRKMEGCKQILILIEEECQRIPRRGWAA